MPGPPPDFQRSSMGGGQSVRATHFTRPVPDEEEEHRISISNKMVERLVEDATHTPPTPAPVEPKPNAPNGPKLRAECMDKIFTEKIRSLDENHSEKSKLTIEDINSLVQRVDSRASSMSELEPVCPELQQRVIQCYKQADGGVIQCWGDIDKFSKCVQEAGASRLRARRRPGDVDVSGDHGLTVRGI